MLGLGVMGDSVPHAMADTLKLPIYVHYGNYNIIPHDNGDVSIRLIDTPYVAPNTYINIADYIRFTRDPFTGFVSIDRFPDRYFKLAPQFEKLTLKEVFLMHLFPQAGSNNLYMWKPSYDHLLVTPNGIHFVNDDSHLLPSRSDIVLTSSLY